MHCNSNTFIQFIINYLTATSLLVVTLHFKAISITFGGGLIKWESIIDSVRRNICFTIYNYNITSGWLVHLAATLKPMSGFLPISENMSFFFWTS